jgi:hypothetical protein
MMGWALNPVEGRAQAFTAEKGSGNVQVTRTRVKDK